MSKEDYSKILGEWEGYSFGSVGRKEWCEEGESKLFEVWIELLPVGVEMTCSGCGRSVSTVYDTRERWVRDLPILGMNTELLVHLRRVACPNCGPRLERLTWLERYSRVTKRLAESVARLCDVLCVREVAKHYDLNWNTVKRIHKRYLKEKLEPADYSGVEVVAMDEFSIQKGQRYATVIVEVKTKRVLWVGRGRGREDIRPFFEALGQEGCKSLKAVVMDMNGAYEVEVKSHCPNAAIVYDLFHLLAKYGREVISKVRTNEAKRLQDNEPARKVIRGSRWLLLRNRKNLTEENQVRLSDLLQANRSLCKVYLLKEDLKALWEYRCPAAALKAWKRWYHRACCSRVEPLRRFAKRLKVYLPGILAHCRWPFHTSLLEGMNNKIKLIKRMAYGFRDYEYFFLRIRSAFHQIR